MTASELSELERTLRNHQQWPWDDYHAAQDPHSNVFLRLAGYLRVLLVDRNMPVLLRYACEKGKVLHAYVQDFDLKKLEGKPMWGWSGYVISWTPDKESKKVTIEEFLQRPIGLYSDDQGLARTYTPTQLIKLTANKEGVAHLDLKKTRVLKEMKLLTIGDEHRQSDSQEIRHAIKAIAGWTHNAIGYVLGEIPAP